MGRCARERRGWEGKGAGVLGALPPAPPAAAGALQGPGIPAEPFLLPRLWSRTALVEMPGFPGWFRLFRAQWSSKEHFQVFPATGGCLGVREFCSQGWLNAGCLLICCTRLWGKENEH